MPKPWARPLPRICWAKSLDDLKRKPAIHKCARRALQAWVLRTNGMSVRRIAAQLKVTARTVNRDLEDFPELEIIAKTIWRLDRADEVREGKQAVRRMRNALAPFWDSLPSPEMKKKLAKRRA